MYPLWFIARFLNLFVWIITPIQLGITTVVTTSLGLGVLSALLTFLCIKGFYWFMGVLINIDKEMK